MYLGRNSCTICEASIPKIKFNLKTTYSKSSKVRLITFVEKFHENVSFFHCNICSDCHDLLNELDTIQQREKEINEKLKKHMEKVQFPRAALFSSNKDSVDDDVIERQVHQDSFEEDGPLEIGDIDLKKLPIKVKRISVSSKATKAVSKPQEIKLRDEDAFEKIQSVIQMNLSKHVQEHLNKRKPSKDLLCEICGQNFKSKVGYDNHLKRHDKAEDTIKLLTLNKSQQYLCHTCGKEFNNKSALGRHLPIHTGETRYQCEHCGKKFLHHSSFTVHKKSHAGLRNYQCALCDQSFFSKSHLQRHTRGTHEKQKGHQCPMCSSKFAENYNLLAHLKTVHSESVLIKEVEESGFEKDDYYDLEETMVIMEENPTSPPMLYNL